MRHILLVALAVSCVLSLQMVNNAPTPAYFSDFRNAELAKHNYDRSLHGCVPLVISNTLNTAAQAYAEQLALANSNTLSHSPSAMSGTYGENLYKAWGSPSLTYKLGTASDRWYSEVKYYDYTTFKSNTTGKAVGHFTAMIWKSVKSVGFGIKKVTDSSGDTVYVVANYSPTPNYIGQYAANVPRPL
jgi:glioma pathogenesis-related protein 2